MNEKESSRWNTKKDESLKEIKKSMIDSLKDIKWDICMDKIASVQDRLYSILSKLPACRSLFQGKTENEETTEVNYRVQGVVKAVHNDIIREKIYGKTENQSSPIGIKQAKPVQETKQSLWYSLKEIQFDIIKNDYAAVDGKLPSALRYLYEWRRLVPEKARRITASTEYSPVDDGRIQGFIDRLDRK